MDHLDLNLLFSLQVLEYDVKDDCIWNWTNTKEYDHFNVAFNNKQGSRSRFLS